MLTLKLFQPERCGLPLLFQFFLGQHVSDAESGKQHAIIRQPVSPEKFNSCVGIEKERVFMPRHKATCTFGVGDDRA